MPGTLLAIATRPKTGAPMQTHQSADVSCEAGISGDHRRRPGKRQVTVLPIENWQAACDELGQPDIPWTVRRANLLVSGLSLGEAAVGKRLVLGELELEITGETDPCRKMDEAVTGLRKALEPNWRGGVTCKVIKPGSISPGQVICLA